jgi:hypothetical protein
MKTVLFSAGLTILTATSAFSWGDQGHKAIWAAAQAALTPKATLLVSQILNHDKLAMTATWLDQVRSAEVHGTGLLKNDAEALAFISSFPSNTNWHFVDLPLGSSAYDPASPFVSSDDVVHAVNFCITVLEGHDTSLSMRINPCSSATPRVRQPSENSRTVAEMNYALELRNWMSCTECGTVPWWNWTPVEPVPT